MDEDHNVTLVSNQIQKELDKIKLPDGYEISMTGVDETIRDAISFSGISVVSPLIRSV